MKERTRFEKAPTPPPPTGQSDQLDRTAHQVRYTSVASDGRSGAVHAVATVRPHSRHATVGGVSYETECGEVMPADDGAILTTRDVTCSKCGAPEVCQHGLLLMGCDSCWLQRHTGDPFGTKR